MTITRIAAVTSSAVVLAAILAGLYFSGSPVEQRLQRIDERRVSDLRQLASAINQYHEVYGRLPGDLASLVDGQRMSSIPADPETGNRYKFEIIGAGDYRLCAAFSTDARAGQAEDFWSHPGGVHCYDFRQDIGEESMP